MRKGILFLIFLNIFLLRIILKFYINKKKYLLEFMQYGNLPDLSTFNKYRKSLHDVNNSCEFSGHFWIRSEHYWQYSE